MAVMFLFVLAGSALAQPLLAQRRPAPRAAGATPRAGSWEISGGIVYISGFDLGDRAAEETRNSTTPGTGPFDLFNTSSKLDSTVGYQGRLGFYFSPKLSVEGGVRYAKPVLSIRITGDTENAADQTAEEELSQYLIDGSVLWHFGHPSRTGGGVVPFVMGGAGYLRELHEGDELVETGIEYHFGAGVKIWFGNGPGRFGIRGEAGLSIRDGGFDFEDKIRTGPVAAGSLVYMF
jgi:outer membrane protein with beta-barrel domain